MIDCQCSGIEDVFNEKLVAQELAQYRAKGPKKTTRMIIDAMKVQGIEGLNLLDVGGGIGAIQHQLIAAGVNQATDVDASQAYLQAARDEAARRGLAERVDFIHGDFVQLAAQIPPTDIVTLDRVVCCYADMEKLVGLSAARAKKLYGLVYPRDAWWVKIGIKIINLFFRIRKSTYRSYVHPTQAVDAVVRGQGLKRRSIRQTWVWQVVVYSR